MLPPVFEPARLEAYFSGIARAILAARVAHQPRVVYVTTRAVGVRTPDEVAGAEERHLATVHPNGHVDLGRDLETAMLTLADAFTEPVPKV